MDEKSLDGRRILIVEDEFLLADELADSIHDAGGKVLGPASTLKEAMQLASTEQKIDFAVLDVNLAGDMVYPVADALNKRKVPFAFFTGYDEWSLPERFFGIPRVEKPFNAGKLATKLAAFMENQSH